MNYAQELSTLFKVEKNRKLAYLVAVVHTETMKSEIYAFKSARERQLFIDDIEDISNFAFATSEIEECSCEKPIFD